jgi:predicted outer membrane protein
MGVARLWWVVILCCFVSPATPLCAQSSEHATQNSGDKQFLKAAGESTLCAIEFSSAVKNRTPTVAVRAYAEGVIDDNHQIRQTLLHLASNEGVTLATNLSAAENDKRMQLAKIPPAQLDEQYARLMASQIQTNISQFRQEAAGGADPLVKDFARKTLTRLQGELDQARQIADASQR